MPGHFCDQCQGFIDATKDQLSDADVKKLQDECSRHKPPTTRRPGRPRASGERPSWTRRRSGSNLAHAF